MEDDILKNDIVDLPDIPMPDVVESKEVKDEFDAAFKFAFIGIGHGGSRIAETFYKLGYRRVCAVNTAKQDLASISIPEENKLVIGERGAGKDPAIGQKAVLDHAEDIHDLMRRSFGEKVDRIIICCGAGGGTGAGGAIPLIKVSRSVLKALRVPGVKVGVIAALPNISEGQRPARNALSTASALAKTALQGGISPLVLIDNEKIRSIYPGVAVAKFWDTANSSICTLFHLFNKVSKTDTEFVSFDPKDYDTVLSSGIITFGATPVTGDWMDQAVISKAVRENLRNNILSASDLGTGTIAGAVIIGGENVMAEMPNENLDHAFEMLTRIMADGSTVHRGVYKGNKDQLAVYTVVGGLNSPAARLVELKQLGSGK